MSPDAIISFPMFGDGFVMNIPRYFQLFGFNIYYYGIFVAAGYALAGVYLIKRRKLFGLTSDNLLDLVLIALICGLVGARLYYMIFNFDRFFAPGQWGNIFRFRDGGLAVYGGIIASGLGYFVYGRIKKLPIGTLLDAAGFGLFIGQAVGRWGNFINREAYGVETNLPWRMGLTSRGSTIFVHPCFLYESLWNVAGLLMMHFFSKKSKTKYPGQYFLFYAAWYGLGRFMIEGLRTDSLLIPGTDNRASQWLAALSCLAALIILFVNFLRGKEGGFPVPADDDDNDKKDKDSDDDKDVDDKKVAEDSDTDDDPDDDDNDDDDDPDDDDDDDDDEVDAEDKESEEDLADVDGASADEIEEGEEFETDAEDTEAAKELAAVDGASAEEIDAESDDDDSENTDEKTEEINDKNIEEDQ